MQATPDDERQSEVASPLDSPPRRLTGLRVLVTEDDPTCQLLVCELLRAEGAETEIAASGLDAIALLRKASQRYDCVLMDIQMPGMNGFAACRFIRAELGLKQLPIIAVTAHAKMSDRKDAMVAGMNDHIAKPFTVDHLVAAILRHAGRASKTPSASSREPNDTDRAEGFDFRKALGRFGNNIAVYQRALMSFSAESRSIVAALPAALADGTACTLLHDLKGLAAIIGATDLAKLAAEARAHDTTALTALLPQLNAATSAAADQAEILAASLDPDQFTEVKP